MKAFVNYMIRLLIKECLKLFWFLPVRKNRILFYSFAGRQYSCNPKYLTEYILEHMPRRYEIIWAFNEPDAFDYLDKKKINIIRFRSFKFLIYVITSKIIITNDTPPAYIPFRPSSQFVLSTWHGGGAYKKVALDEKNITFFQRKFLLSSSAQLTKMISSCKKFSEAFHQAYLVPYSKFISCGMPRNDILINQNKPEVIKKVRKYFYVPADVKILLYAPTYRGENNIAAEDFHNVDASIDLEKLINSLVKRFGGNWCIMYRAHYYFSKKIKNSNVINASDYPDMQELLYAADVLITDYSSSMWDFSFTYKPCFLFATDLNQYDNERGFYTPVQSWPFPLAQNNDELEKVILNFDEDKYRKDVQRHHKELGSYEKGNACETVCKLLFSLK